MHIASAIGSNWLVALNAVLILIFSSFSKESHAERWEIEKDLSGSLEESLARRYLNLGYFRQAASGQFRIVLHSPDGTQVVTLLHGSSDQLAILRPTAVAPHNDWGALVFKTGNSGPLVLVEHPSGAWIRLADIFDPDEFRSIAMDEIRTSIEGTDLVVIYLRETNEIMAALLFEEAEVQKPDPLKEAIDELGLEGRRLYSPFKVKVHYPVRRSQVDNLEGLRLNAYLDPFFVLRNLFISPEPARKFLERLFGSLSGGGGQAKGEAIFRLPQWQAPLTSAHLRLGKPVMGPFSIEGSPQWVRTDTVHGAPAYAGTGVAGMDRAFEIYFRSLQVFRSPPIQGEAFQPRSGSPEALPANLEVNPPNSARPLGVAPPPPGYRKFYQGSFPTGCTSYMLSRLARAKKEKKAEKEKRVKNEEEGKEENGRQAEKEAGT